ncbi:hypothetical protein PIB30_101108 [Stylosanthes scabra]|uniref:Uncharacterized protein n=1 Tax=Stylosanthes scabra TaxID=79078 RepID=A0ABU6RXJ3_9FABA|nr:hypothetical protein [Stylosanthes scabra]
MADRKRKGKAVATSSNQASPRFKTLYHEAHFNSMLSARRILPELILQADEDVFNPIRYQSTIESGRSSQSRFKPLAISWSRNFMLMLGNRTKQTGSIPLTLQA